MGAAILDLDALPKAKRAPKKPDTSKPRKVATWRRVCRSLRCEGPQTIKALAKGLNLYVHNVTFYINWYLKHGVVERVGRKYKLTEKGANWGKPKPRSRGFTRPKRLTAWDFILKDDETGEET